MFLSFVQSFHRIPIDRISPCMQLSRYRGKRPEGIKKGIPVIFSDESPIVIRPDVAETVGKPEAEIRKAKMPPSSNAFVPSSVGLIAASWVIRDILKDIMITRVQG